MDGKKKLSKRVEGKNKQEVGNIKKRESLIEQWHILLMIVHILVAEIVNILENVKELTEIRYNSQDLGFCVKLLGRISRAKILNTHTQNMPT